MEKHIVGHALDATDDDAILDDHDSGQVAKGPVVTHLASRSIQARLLTAPSLQLASRLFLLTSPLSLIRAGLATHPGTKQDPVSTEGDPNDCTVNPVDIAAVLPGVPTDLDSRRVCEVVVIRNTTLS